MCAGDWARFRNCLVRCGGQFRTERHDAAHGLGGLEANRERAAAFVEQSLAMATALAPIIGYEQAAALAKEASASGRTIREVARERSGIQPAELERLLDPRSQT